MTTAVEATSAAWSAAQDIAYPVPAVIATQPPERSWRIDAERAVLLVHDMQHYFVRRFAADAEPARSLVGNLTRLVATARERGVQVAYTAQPGSMSGTQRGLLADFWGPGMQMTEGDRGIVPGIEPRAEDWVLTKWRYSAFQRTDLLDRFRAAGRDQLVVTGVYGHVGVLTTSLEAYSHDIETFLVGDAIGDFTADDHALTLDLAGQLCAAVLDTATALEQLGGATEGGRR